MTTIAISALAPVARTLEEVEAVDTVYANIRWAGHVYARTDRQTLAHLVRERLVLRLGNAYCLALPVRLDYART